MSNKVSKFVDYAALFSSAGTLTCCALPALMVAIGAGSVLASVVSNVPGLIWISRHKAEVFIFAGVMLVLSGFLRYKSQGALCPTDSMLANTCRRAKGFSSWIYIFSLICYTVGALFAFIFPIFI